MRHSEEYSIITESTDPLKWLELAFLYLVLLYPKYRKARNLQHVSTEVIGEAGMIFIRDHRNLSTFTFKFIKGEVKNDNLTK